MSKVALITGGASGIGLAVAERLVSQGWHVFLLDYNEKAGESAASSLKTATFIKTDVSDYESLSTAVDRAFDRFGTFDLVFANAGVVERDNFYEKRDATKSRIPPQPDMKAIEINLKAVINTCWLAQHYFRLSPHRGKDAVLIATGSVSGLYLTQSCPIYAGSKAGVVNFMRSLAFPCHHYDGIRTFTLCPGTVRTNLLDQTDWDFFAVDAFTTVESIVEAVEMMINGGDMVDSAGRKVPKGEDHGLVVEVNCGRYYFRDGHEYCDENMRKVMEATSMEHQIKRLDGYKSNGADSSSSV